MMKENLGYYSYHPNRTIHHTPIHFQEQNDDGTIVTKQDEGSPSIVIMTLLALLSLFAFHCTWITSSAYSSPSIVLSTGGGGG